MATADAKSRDFGMDFNDFLEWNQERLNNFLKVRGKSTTGNKKDLAARALVAFENGEPVTQSAEDSAQKLEKEYNELLEKFTIQDPLKIPNHLWSTDVKKWPNLNLGQIFQYVIDNKAFEGNYIGQYKARKAYSYFQSGHVQQIYQYMINDEQMFFKACVVPSMRVNERPREGWILFSKHNGVLTAHCTCIAGYSKSCNHIISILYKVNFACEHGLNSPSCTEVACKFNDKTRYDIEPKKVVDLPIVKDDIMNKDPKYQIMNQEKSNFDPRLRHQTIEESDSAVRIQTFLEKIRKCAPNAAVLLNFPVDEENDCPPPFTEIAEQVKSTAGLSEVAMLEDFMNKISFRDSQFGELEKLTKGQADNKMWTVQRTGRITASNFHDVKTKMKEILASRSSVKPATTPLLVKLTQATKIDNIVAIKWGKQNENNAREAFFQAIAAEHKSPKLRMCGLKAFKSAPFLAASADNIFSCACCEVACVEYKCPYSIRNYCVSDKWQDLPYLKQEAVILHLNKSHKYYTQVQGQMAANDCKHSYFVVFTTVGRPLVLNVVFDPSFWNLLYPDLVLFFKLYVAKVLLGIREIKFCAVCHKHILEQNEIAQSGCQSNDQVHCSKSSLTFHKSCCKNYSLMSFWVCDDCGV
eukprot:gene15645-6929_t